jgi:ribosomal protein S18 acetylase RimI-like enzyme
MTASERPTNEDPSVEVVIVTSWDEQEIRNLYLAGGWWKEEWQTGRLNDLIRASYAFAVAYHLGNKKTVGMIRAISDGIADAYIQDLVVLPEFRGLGVGRRLVKALIRHCLADGIHWIALVAEPGTAGFYQPLGFALMDNYVPMRYIGEGKDDQHK